jgi:hypothetical protein
MLLPVAPNQDTHDEICVDHAECARPRPGMTGCPHSNDHRAEPWHDAHVSNRYASGAETRLPRYWRRQLANFTPHAAIRPAVVAFLIPMSRTESAPTFRRPVKFALAYSCAVLGHLRPNNWSPASTMRMTRQSPYPAFAISSQPQTAAQFCHNVNFSHDSPCFVYCCKPLRQTRANFPGILQASLSQTSASVQTARCVPG